MKKILLHCCCGPCTTYTFEWLSHNGFEVTGFWYNPNIHPFTEHQNRLESMQALAEQLKMPLILAEGYDMVKYFQAVVGKEANRCPVCYRLRLGEVARRAAEKGFSAFTTTLLISIYQEQELLRLIGEEAGQQHGVDFYYHNFREGFRESQTMAREHDLYRQKYCGCVYSEWERFGKVKIT